MAPSRRRTDRALLPTGLPVDATGGATIDPTDNVKALMEASIKSLTREMELQARLADAKASRVDADLRGANILARLRAKHQKAFSVLRAEHAKETRLYDNDRWDKIRTIDMANASATATQLLAAVNNYAAAQERMAQTLRDQVASTADAANKNLSALINPIVDRVAILERSSYTVAGRSAVSDPAFAEMVAEMRKLSAAGAVSTGKDAGISLAWVVLLGGIGAIGGLLGIAGVLYAVLKP
jgi:hypothetical protein